MSLRRVLKGLCANRCLITRENYVAQDGLPYDCERAAIYHETFDRLAATRPNARQRSDIIDIAIFDQLTEKLNKCGAEDIKVYGDKFIAHAADARSRQTLTDDQQGISLNKLDSCHRALCKVARTISFELLRIPKDDLISVPHIDPFEYLNQPWLREADIDSLLDFWNARVEHIDKLCDGSAEAVLSDVCRQ
jgi:hypothetical protein